MKRVCPVCGTLYETCYSCERNRSWRTLTDTEEHYFILSVLMDYQGGHDAKQAYKRLRRRGVDLLASGYTDRTAQLFAEIYSLNHKAAAARLSEIAEEPREEETTETRQIQKKKRENA